MRQLLLLSVVALGATGCLHGQRAYMDATTGMAPENASMWTRPQEVGYSLGERLEGEATNQCVLMFICWGAEDGGGLSGAFSGIIGALTGQSAPSDPLVRAAAAGAVLSAATETDGIYVLNHETDSFDIFIYKRKTAKVIGKAVRLNVLGEVSQERADKMRALKSVAGATVQMPFADIH